MAIPCLTKPINIICFKQKGSYSLYVTVYIRTLKECEVLYIVNTESLYGTTVCNFNPYLIFDQHLVHVQCKYTNASSGESGMESNLLKNIFFNLFRYMI